jgi:quercetin dioxygenase-like cupin family protein
MVSALRIWASEDGESHLEGVELAFNESEFLPSAPSMLLTPQEKASGYFIARAPAGLELDWHAAPVRELALYLTGQGEIEASDGTVRPLEPGTILLVEDTNGKGHKTRVTGTEEVLVVIVTLPDDGSIA